jgi:hypothetical protein
MLQGELRPVLGIYWHGGGEWYRGRRGARVLTVAPARRTAWWRITRGSRARRTPCGGERHGQVVGHRGSRASRRSGRSHCRPGWPSRRARRRPRGGPPSPAGQAAAASQPSGRASVPRHSPMPHPGRAAPAAARGLRPSQVISQPERHQPATGRGALTVARLAGSVTRAVGARSPASATTQPRAWSASTTPEPVERADSRRGGAGSGPRAAAFRADSRRRTAARSWRHDCGSRGGRAASRSRAGWSWLTATRRPWASTLALTPASPTSSGLWGRSDPGAATRHPPARRHPGRRPETRRLGQPRHEAIEPSCRMTARAPGLPSGTPGEET